MTSVFEATRKWLWTHKHTGCLYAPHLIMLVVIRDIYLTSYVFVVVGVELLWMYIFGLTRCLEGEKCC